MVINDTQQKTVDVSLLLGMDGIADSSVNLWGKLAVELSDIIGENGFQALYMRCAHRARLSYPWLPSGDHIDFLELKQSLEQQPSPHALEASIELFNTFINTLTLLIGSALTAAIIQSAWEEEIMASSQKGIQ